MKTLFAVLPLLGAIIAAGLMSVSSPTGTAEAQDPNPFCGPFFPNAPSDPRLSIQLAAQASVKTVEDDELHGRRAVDEIQISWSVDAAALGADCIWIGRSDSGAPSPGIAEARVSASDRSVKLLAQGTPPGEPTLVCFRLIPISRTGVGSASQLCATVTNPRGPVSPDVGDVGPPPGPPNVGRGLADGDSSAWAWAFAVVTGTIAGVLALRALAVRRR